MKLACTLAALLLAAATAAWPAANPIAHMAHGGLFGADGRQLEPTLALVREALDALQAQVAAQASAAQRAQHAQRQRHIDSLLDGDAQGLLVARAMALDALLREVQPADASTLSITSRVLQQWLQWRLPAAAGAATAALARAVPQRYALSDHALSLLAQAGLARDTLVPAATRKKYKRDCEGLGVPIPRDWGAAGAWTSRNAIDKVFIINNRKAELFVAVPRATDPEGVCLALPRYDPTEAVPKADLLGIICMGKKIVKDGAGKDRVAACFWDWQGLPPIQVTGLVTPLADFKSAPEFDTALGRCSDCHAGANAYVVHPEQAAFSDPGLDLDAAAWPLPQVQATWPQNPIPVKVPALLAAIRLDPAKEGSCVSCHELPEISLATPADPKAGLMEYCADVMLKATRGKGAVKATMPPSTETLDFRQHIEALLAECKKTGAFIPAPPP
jgi:hypothetical protein